METVRTFFMVSVADIIQRFVYVCIYIYIYIHGFRRWFSFVWFPSSQETCYGFRRWFFGGFRRGRKTFSFFYGFRCWIVGGFRRRRIHNFRMYRAIPRFVFKTGFRCCFLLWFPSWQENVVLWFPSLVFPWFPSWQRIVCLWFPSLVLFMVSGCYRTAAVSPMETILKKRTIRTFP